MDAFGKDPECRVIVLTGVGVAFCAGAALGGGGKGTTGAGKDGFFPDPQNRLLSHPTRIPKPVICCINGACAGMGLALAMFCDVRFVAAEAKVTTAFSKLGLVAEHGLSWTLPKAVGTGRAMMMLMASEIVLGTEAQVMGIAERCYPRATVLEETVKFARGLAMAAPAASLAVIKQQVWTHPTLAKEEALLSSNRLMSVSAWVGMVALFHGRRAGSWVGACQMCMQGGAAGGGGVMPHGRSRSYHMSCHHRIAGQLAERWRYCRGGHCLPAKETGKLAAVEQGRPIVEGVGP
jgi:enoyl-CoA hydratase/carnithine racemase